MKGKCFWGVGGGGNWDSEDHWGIGCDILLYDIMCILLGSWVRSIFGVSGVLWFKRRGWIFIIRLCLG